MRKYAHKYKAEKKKKSKEAMIIRRYETKRWRLPQRVWLGKRRTAGERGTQVKRRAWQRLR